MSVVCSHNSSFVGLIIVIILSNYDVYSVTTNYKYIPSEITLILKYIFMFTFGKIQEELWIIERKNFLLIGGHEVWRGRCE